MTIRPSEERIGFSSTAWAVSRSSVVALICLSGAFGEAESRRESGVSTFSRSGLRDRLPGCHRAGSLHPIAISAATCAGMPVMVAKPTAKGNGGVPAGAPPESASPLVRIREMHRLLSRLEPLPLAELPQLTFWHAAHLPVLAPLAPGSRAPWPLSFVIHR